MLPLLLQLAAAAGAAGGDPGGRPAVERADSVYATPALRALVTQASEENRRVPAALLGYRAAAESEIVIAARGAGGVEATASVEQVASAVAWRRGGEYEQRVIGYRSRQTGLTFSALTFLRQAWTVPALYGNRLSLLFGAPPNERAGRRGRSRRRPVVAVHPLAEDRERVYRFAGGDTVVTIGVGGRRIPIVRVTVSPRRDRPLPAGGTLSLFEGEVDLDAVRRHVVRMRGRFVVAAAPARRGVRAVTDRIVRQAVTAVAYVELVNGEIAGEYWLPTFQRVELQSAIPVAGEARGVLRMVTRFRDYRIDALPRADTSQAASTALLDSAAAGDSAARRPAADTIAVRRHRLTFAPADSVRAFRGWGAELGGASEGTRADDFDDLAPDVWRPTGPPRVEFRSERGSELFHFNRVEGAYTGGALLARFRDRAPGVEARAALGYAWSERAVRGHASATRRRGRWTYALRGGRTLDITNDFRDPFDSGSTIAALLGADDYDYVDRRWATARVARRLGARGPLVQLESGWARDSYAAAALGQAPVRLFSDSSGYRPNRGAAAGSYARSLALVQYQPEVSTAFARPGLGVLARYERGDGELAWQRAELRVAAVRARGRAAYGGRLDAGALFGRRPPPQQLFEMGGERALAGYGYKEFGGDRAVLLRGFGAYSLGVLRAPIRVLRRYYLPAPAPSLAAAAQGGWIDAVGAGTREALAALNVDPRTGAPLDTGDQEARSRPTDGVRASVKAGIALFGGGLFVGAARPIDHRARWRASVGVAQEF